ncbi:MAG: carboxypeptidase-like regulatory domain-containing protein, partial [Tannerellaceae bacterium]|nr:carboxypeptidase-like regulatory domain-containing protein [Tannerellaceae bacterium]
MKNTCSYRLFTIVWLGVWITLLSPLQAMPNDVLDRTFKLARQKATRYHLLEKITELSGFFFIYDSSIIEEDAVITLPSGEYTLRNAVYIITGNPHLNLRIVGNHILMELPAAIPPTGMSETTGWFTIEGYVTDKYTHEAIPAVSIHV